MTQNVPRNLEQIVPEEFFDSVQEMLSGAAINFTLVAPDATHVRVPAGAGHAQAAISIGGAYRFAAANVTSAAHPAVAARISDIHATALANQAYPAAGPVGGDHSFGLAFTASGGTPGGVDISRKVGEALWDGARIVAVNNTVAAEPSARGRNYVAIPGQEATTSNSFTTLATPDQVSVAVGAGDILRVRYQAMWAAPGGPGQAAIFIGANQLVVPGVGSGGGSTPLVAQLATLVNATAGTFRPLTTWGMGLVTNDQANADVYPGDATTGQAFGVALGAAQSPSVTPAVVAGVPLGGPCEIFGLPAGIYTVSVRFKSGSSTSLAVKNRQLWVESLDF